MTLTPLEGYGALNYLEKHQGEIESALAKLSEPRAKGAIFLYDVTSVYFEGQKHELAEFGYNRDGKKGKKQMVVGLLTDASGEPLSIQLYPGNTSDPPTFLDAVGKLKVRFGTQEIAVAGDRGMIKRMGKQALGEAGFRYVTAMTDPQVKGLLKQAVLTLELFDEQPVEVEARGKRYVLRCNPHTKAREQARREDQTSEKWGCDPKNTAEFDSLDSGQFRHPAPRAKRPPAGRGPAGQPGESPHGSTFIFSSISER